ncbi:transcriptional regulator domain-containing protein [Sphingobium yanoikuyae]|uniref:transcriptional regulator domain-containing protein n=1 Tax=Sphingobium yanoikuyae TaxID=13690 RepID=UPI00345EE05A
MAELLPPRQLPAMAEQTGMGGNEAAGRQQLDLPGFAQEFLRRNLRYRAEYHALAILPAGQAPSAREVMARRWGLSFPLCPRHVCRSAARALASAGGAGGPHPGHRAV